MAAPGARLAKPLVMQLLKHNEPIALRDNNPEKGAVGWAFLVWLFGGGLGLAIVVFIILKLL